MFGIQMVLVGGLFPGISKTVYKPATNLPTAITKTKPGQVLANITDRPTYV